MEQRWEEASMPGVESGTHQREVSPIPSGCLPLSFTVGGTVGGSWVKDCWARGQARQSQPSRDCQTQGALAHPRAYFLFPRANGDPRHKLLPFSSHFSEYLLLPASKHPL